MSGKMETYKTTGKCDDQHHYKAINEASMVSTPEGFTENIPMAPNQYEPTKNPSAIKSLCRCSEALDIKYKTVVCGLGEAKARRKATIAGKSLWSNTANLRDHTRINQKVKEALYN